MNVAYKKNILKTRSIDTVFKTQVFFVRKQNKKKKKEGEFI